MYIKSPLRRLLLARNVQHVSDEYWHRMDSYNYEQVFPERHRNQIEFTRAHLVSRMKPTDSVIDFGCADGWHALILAAHCRQLRGYDFNEKLVALANQAAAEQGAAHCRFDWADILKLKLPPQSADVALICGLTTCLVRDGDALKALRLAARTLRPDGLALFKETLHCRNGTRLNYQDTYGASYRDRGTFLSLCAKAGFKMLVEQWIDTVDEYGSFMALGQRITA